MAVEIFKLFGSIFVNNDEANKSISDTDKKAKNTHSTLGSGIKAAAKWGAAITTAAGGVGAAMIASASSFESSFAKTSTLLNGNIEEIEKYKKSIINASNETGVATDEMCESVYSAISAGVDQADAVDFVTESLKLAKGGFTDTSTAVDVLTTALNAYGMSSDEATRISDVLITTQNLGKTTVDELASSMGKVIPLASAYGVNVENLGASYATLTAGGIATSEATTYMKGMFTELSKESSKVSSILKDKTGKSFTDLMNEGKSVGDVMQILSDSVNGDSTAFAGLWSSTEAGTGALAIVNAGADAFNTTLGEMQNSAGATSKAFDTMEDTFSVKVEKIKNRFVNMGTEIGNKLLPIVEKISESILNYMPQIQSFIDRLAPVFNQFFDNIMPKLLDIGGQILPIIIDLLAQFLPVISTLFEALAPVIEYFIGQLLPALMQFIEQIMPAVLSVIEAIIPLIETIFALIQPFIDVFIQLLEPIATLITNAIAPLIEKFAVLLNNLLQPLIPVFQDIANIILETLSPVFNQLSPVFDKISQALEPFFELLSLLLNKIIPLLVPIIQNLADIFTNRLGSAIDFVSSILDNIMVILGGLIDFISGVFSGNWEQAWNGIVDVFKGILNSIPTTMEFIINGAIGLINGLLSGINWAVEWIGWDIPTIPELTLPRFRAGIDYVPNDKFAAYLDAGEAVLNAQEAEEYRKSKMNSYGSPFSGVAKEKIVNVTNYIEINIPNVNVQNDTDIKELSEELSERLAAEIEEKMKKYE